LARPGSADLPPGGPLIEANPTRQQKPSAAARAPEPPDVILSQSTPATAALKRETQTIPVVFVIVADPVGSGFVASLPRPGGNITGFINVEAAMGSKWLELLSEIAPGLKRVAIMFNPNVAAGAGSYYLPSFEAAAQPLKIASITAPVHSDAEVETFITSLGREPGGGLVVSSEFYDRPSRAHYVACSPKQLASGLLE
jgi:putative ABC transport system substrate-binding protein